MASEASWRTPGQTRTKNSVVDGARTRCLEFVRRASGARKRDASSLAGRVLLLVVSRGGAGVDNQQQELNNMLKNAQHRKC